MIEFLVAKLHDARFMTMLLAAIAASATAYTLIMPLFAGEGLAKRMKAVASERERLRQRERDRLNKSEKVSLRQTPKQLVSKVVEDFNLTKWLAQEAARDKLIMAGYRGHAPYVTFLFSRAVTPIVLFLGAALYVFVITNLDKPLTVKIGICLGAAYLGLQAPMLFLKNAISKRQLSIKRAFPDALDLLLICIESGMSVEVAFRKVASEIASQSIALSEEFALTTAELSYLQDRKVAYENLAKRTGLEGVKSVCLALMQSERYGTPLGQSLRVMAQENRDMRMNEAEKKAAALPPKLTVPMILFFLPCLFIVILGPTYIKIQMMPVRRSAQRTRDHLAACRSPGLRLQPKTSRLAKTSAVPKPQPRLELASRGHGQHGKPAKPLARPDQSTDRRDAWIDDEQLWMIGSTRLGGDDGCDAQSGRLSAATGTALLPGRELSLSLRLSISRR